MVSVRLALGAYTVAVDPKPSLGNTLQGTSSVAQDSPEWPWGGRRCQEPLSRPTQTLALGRQICYISIQRILLYLFALLVLHLRV